jgi:hypothetical protein
MWWCWTITSARDAAARAGRGEPQPAGRGPQPRAISARRGGVPDAGRGEPAAARGGRAGPDLMAMLDLVALATVADVAPLIGVNRAFVRQGLKVMARRERPGSRGAGRCRADDAGADGYHLGFVLGPRVNAGGRIGRRRPGRAASGDRRTRRGAGDGRSGSTSSTPSAARSRPGARGGAGAGRGARVRRPAGLGRGRGLASGRRRHRRRAAEGGGEPPRRGDRLRRGCEARARAGRWRASTWARDPAAGAPRGCSRRAAGTGWRRG